jgi:hypothetical protein
MTDRPDADRPDTHRPDTDRPATDDAPGGRLSRLRPFVVPLLAVLAFLLFRALTTDDGTHDVRTGDCVAASGADAFARVDCGATGSLGTVTYVDRTAATDDASALALCTAHGADRAFTSADARGGQGTVVCVRARR